MVEEWHKLGAEELPRLQKEKLTAFGFRLCNTDLVYETYLLGGIFRMSVKITDRSVTIYSKRIKPWGFTLYKRFAHR